jgi:STE24 endopeptidase
MNPIGIFILAAMILEFALYRWAEALNLRSAGAAVPEDFREFYDAQRYARAQAYLKARTRLAGAASGFFLAATLAFWLSGGFGCLDAMVRSLGLGPVLSGLVYIGALLLARAILAGPFQAYAVFVIEERFGFNRTTLATFLLDGVKALVLSVLIGAPLLAGLLALFAHAGPHAWFYTWMLAVLFMAGIQFAAPRFILPLFNQFTPLEEGELRTAVLDYARSIRFPLENVFVMDGSRRSTKGNAFFTGCGRHRRIALYDTLIRAHTTAELLAVLAHEVGHYRRHHLLKQLALGAVQTGVLLFAFSAARRWPPLFEAFFVPEPSVYAGLVAFALLIRPLEPMLGLVLNALARSFEREADRFAVETTRDGGALASALKKLSAENLANLSPHPLHVALSYSHPPVRERIRAIETSAAPIRAAARV